MSESETQPSGVPLNQTQCESIGGTWDAENNKCIMPSEAAPKPPTDSSLRRENEMLRAQIETRERQLRQAIEIANRANDERNARKEAEKARLIQSIQMDGKFTKDELQGKTLDELNTMRLTLDRSIEKTFASVAAEIDEQRKRKQPVFTLGTWDSASQTWKGGVE